MNLEGDDVLSAETEDVLRRARLGERMPGTHKRRLKGTVLARIAFAGTLVAAPATAVGIVAKTVAAVAIVGSLSAGGYLALRPARHAPTPPPRVALAPRAEAPAVPVEIDRPAARRRPIERRVAASPASDLATETNLLRGADRALRAGDTATAIALLDEHAARFPKGALAPERAAERLILSCEVGVADPRRVEQFLSSHPGSPLAARVRRACALRP